MICEIKCEVRGLEKKVSSKANVYYILRCEDLRTGKPFEVSVDGGFDVSGLKRGLVCTLCCDFVAGRDWYCFRLCEFVPLVLEEEEGF